ncbi:MAG: hypothetical protein QW597_05435 [Thermoplasmataceae archaeon]
MFQLLMLKRLVFTTSVTPFHNGYMGDMILGSHSSYNLART